MTTKAWKIYTQDVKPLRKKKIKPTAKQDAVDKAAARAGASHEPIKLSKIGPRQSLSVNVFLPLERNREKLLRQGDIEIDAKLDLHGMTQVEAFEALADFMRKKTKAGKRNLLIITGKGIAGEGVLRRNLNAWLGQLIEASSILALRPAAPKHGGEGAFYIVLRKK
ncbi:MAG: Smr/MutS family protein [Bdellovibrionales bacterium]